MDMERRGEKICPKIKVYEGESGIKTWLAYLPDG